MVYILKYNGKMDGDQSGVGKMELVRRGQKSTSSGKGRCLSDRWAHDSS